ncbi:MAG: class B sortase [Massiliimalia sp.]|jgi:sortase B
MGQKSRTEKKKTSPVRRFFLLVFAGILVVSGFLLLRELWDFHQADQVHDQLKEQIVSSSDGTTLSPQEKYAPLIQVNSDFIGWITLEGTRIDYGVVQGEDNSHYLSTDFYGNPHRLGTVFLDCRAQFQAEKQSDHLVLYGHSAKDGSFFADVRKYKKLDFYQEHPIIEWSSIYEGDTRWIIFAAYMIDASDSSDDAFWFQDYIDFKDESEYNEFINGINQRNYFQNDIDLAFGDQFLTLSTCDYDFDNARFVITARRLRQDETEQQFDVKQWTERPDKKMPDRWYQ